MLNVTESRLLNEKEAFERWMTNLRWRNFRKKIVNEIIMKKPAALRNPQKSKEAIKSPTLYELRSKSSTLGYPLADNNNKSTPIWKRSGYVNKKKVQFPSIDGKNSEDQNNQNEKVNNDHTNKASSNRRKPLHFPTTRFAYPDDGATTISAAVNVTTPNDNEKCAREKLKYTVGRGQKERRKNEKPITDQIRENGFSIFPNRQ
ncbi:unnamed protein product [Clavelina lepadiformis]|uniref:Uncharacterized protein n=1 Tax=Clavelina lepadiformis TaxID=159417 RepID=A0ABP0FXH6_CLALP